MTMHTKGPWKIYRKTSVEIEASPHRSYVAYAGTEANARLIAAAPELLEALEKIAGFGTNQLHPPSDLLLVQVWANEAIRKATGA